MIYVYGPGPGRALWNVTVFATTSRAPRQLAAGEALAAVARVELQFFGAAGSGGEAAVADPVPHSLSRPGE